MEKYSHSSYIDFIYNFGLIGTIIIISYIIDGFRKNKLLNIKLAEKDAEYVRIIKIAMLVTSITLPLSNEVIFLLFFL